MREEIDRLLGLIDECGITSRNYPSYLEEAFQNAISAKRRGEYKKSLSIINDIISSEGNAYTGILNGAFKTIASSGYLNDAIKILKLCDREMQNNSQAMMLAQMGIPNNFQDHLSRIWDATISEHSLIQYLSSISGNPYYSLPRDYFQMVEEIDEL